MAASDYSAHVAAENNTLDKIIMVTKMPRIRAFMLTQVYYEYCQYISGGEYEEKFLKGD